MYNELMSARKEVVTLANENEVWELARHELANILSDFSEVSLKLWFGSMELKTLTPDKAYFQIETDYKQEIITKRYYDDIKKAMANVLGFEVEIVIISVEKDTFENGLAKLLDEQSAAEEKRIAETVGNFGDNYKRMDNSYLEREIKPNDDDKTGQVLVSPSLPDCLPEYTFENFVVGSSNKMAYTAARTVAQSPADSHSNPLFIYGDPGLGKTHLLYAITREVTKRFPKYNIIYVKGEDFTNELIEALALKAPVQFREKYRNADMLLVDDIQFIAGKYSVQEEFFHTFDALYESGKQIVISSDRPPKSMQTLEERLRSRFESGLLYDIQAPDLELRVAIFKRKANSIGIDIPNDVLMYLGENIKDNIRQIEGALKKMRALAFIQGEEISMVHAKIVVNDLLSSSAEAVTPQKILEYVSQKYAIPTEDITSSKRSKDIMYARHITIYLIRSMTDMSLSAIGSFFNRDHTTIMSSVDRIENDINNSPDFENTINEMKRDIKSGSN